MVTLALPTGSLTEPTLRLFDAAGLAVRRVSARSLRATIAFPGVRQVVFCKPREIPGFVADGVFDLGLTGSDWIEETGAKVEPVRDFNYSKATEAGWGVVLAVPVDHPATTIAQLPPGTRIATEYPTLAGNHFQRLGLEVTVVHSHGSTEAKVPDLADAVLEVVETGTSLRHNGLRELATVRRCVPRLIANPQAWGDPRRRAAIDRLSALLGAATAAAEHTLLTVLTPADRWDAVRDLLPARWWRLGGQEGVVVAQAPYPLVGLAEAITALVDAGAVQVVETAVAKLVER
ncbi:ATP phosphoribosyltransferase [Actinokineospora bangkokensis]|uniref:ATP phosphoribosyltransferase n=1 Tax=Actinokineospora bangkokensis TaxID=1193682 RepID=A0A1Q9LJS9_9PSEU|nr:ATP phosphoribosyltransferase [Actinokineospora bangkokensis]OLR92239.1 ATP phosphoribosyltransferase [Actinokineospora bangkokensis]